VYGPQKGASPSDVATLDAALTRWADVVEAAVGGRGGPPSSQECHPAATQSEECHPAAIRAGERALRDRPGAGAAGGVGFGAMAVLGAELQSGIGLVLDLVGFARHLPGACLVVTGEGSLDAQTLSGKTPAGVAAAAKEAGIPVVTVSGRVVLTPDQLAAAGIHRAYALADIESDPERCFAEAGPLLEELARTLANDWLKEET
jgi:glycerate kinase